MVSFSNEPNYVSKKSTKERTIVPSFMSKKQSSVHVFTLPNGEHISPKRRRELLSYKVAEWEAKQHPYCKVYTNSESYGSYDEVHADLLVILANYPHLTIWWDKSKYLVIYRTNASDPVVWRAY